MAGSNTQGDLQPATETGENLDGEQQQQMGDMLAMGEEGGAGDPQPQPEDEGPAGDQLTAVEDEDGSYTIEEGEYDDEYDEQAETAEAEASEEGEEEEDNLSPLERRLLEQNQRLEQRVDQLLSRLDGGKEGEAEPVPPQQTIPEVDPEELLTADDWASFDDDPMTFLKNYTKKLHARIIEDALSQIPSVVETATQQSVTVAQARQEFKQKFPDVTALMNENSSVRDLVARHANQIQQENPGWSASQIFNETGKEVRALFKLDKEADATERNAREEANNQPSKPRGRRRGATKDNRSGQQKQVDEMLTFIGR